MARRCGLLLMVATVAVCPLPSPAQTTPAPLFSLPADGTWVEYEWKALDEAQRELTGVLRISSVGRKEVPGSPCRWIELKRESKQSGQSIIRLRKLLVSETAFAKGRPLPECVLEGFAWSGPGSPVMRLAPAQLKDFLGLGFEGLAVPFKEVREKEEVLTPFGKFATRYVESQGKSGQRVLEYRGWLTDGIPFGWAKFEIHELGGATGRRLLFRATAIQRGQGAKGELAEAKHPR